MTEPCGAARRLRWELTRFVWDAAVTLKFRANKPRAIPMPPATERQIRRIPLSEQYPAIPLARIRVADHVPPDEKARLALFACKMQAAACRRFPPTMRGLPAIDANPLVALDRACTRRHVDAFRRPELPAEYQYPIDLGSLAVAGPYFCYLRKKGAHYEWDLSDLNSYQRHPGLRRIGVRVRFAVDESGRRLRAEEIDCELGRCTPPDPQWELAQRIALCAATTHLSLVRHFTDIHLALVAQFAITTRNTLPSNHRLRRLLWPHVWGAQYSNNLVTEILMMPGGDFEEIFSFTHAGLCDLLTNAYRNFRIQDIDPERYQAAIADPRIDLPGLDNHLALWKVIHEHAQHYLAASYSSGEMISKDPYVQEWFKDLDENVPGGITALAGPKITVSGLARLVAGFIYASTVQHEAFGSKLWDYQLWTDVQPVRMYRDGRREPLDLYQRLVNYNFMLNVRRTPLLQDLSYLGGNQRTRTAFGRFLTALAELQTQLAGEPTACWKIYPADLEVSANG